MPVAVVAAAFLFNLGQGVLRPSLPLYLQRTFAANYRMVTLIPVVFGIGKWVASLPTGYVLHRLGRPLMVTGLALIALIDIASVMTRRFEVFLGLRALGGVAWAMFATVATNVTVSSAAQRRGRTVSVLLMSETAGLFLGSAAGGWLYESVGIASPFVFEATCMVIAAIMVGYWASLHDERPPARQRSSDGRLLRGVLRTPGVFLMGVTSAVLTAIQTGALVFLFPLYLLSRGGAGPQTVGAIVSLGVLGRLLALWFGGGLSDRWGRMRVLIPGLLFYAAWLVGVSLLAQPATLAMASFVIGAAAGLVAVVPTALTGDQVERPRQGVAIGWLRTMSDTGQIVGPLVMGSLADAIDLSAPFLFGAMLLVTMAWACHCRTNALAVGVGAEDATHDHRERPGAGRRRPPR